MTDTPTPAMTPDQRAELVTKLRYYRNFDNCKYTNQLETDSITIATLTAERDAAHAEIARLAKINVKLCADFNLMNQHGAKQDAEIARLTAALATPDQIAALAAVRAATVTVKPLVWEDIAPRHSKAALPLFGSIRAESWGGDYSVVWSVPGMCDTFTHGKWATLDAAKAAAQADYDSRIRSAITITSGADRAKLDKAAEALQGLVRYQKSILADVLTAHNTRGAGASEWMREDDRDFMRDLRAAFEVSAAVLAEIGGA